MKALHVLVIRLPTRSAKRPDRDMLAVHLARFLTAA